MIDLLYNGKLGLNVGGLEIIYLVYTHVVGMGDILDDDLSCLLK